MFKTNKEIKLEHSCSIIEYDIKSANVSVSREYNLLNDDLLDKISKMEKTHRVIAMGKIMRKNKEFSKELEKSFNDVIERFISQNELDIKKDIISIKRDAVFVLNKPIKKSTIGDYIKFEEKNMYHAYLYLKPYELYFKRNGDIDIKGLNDDNKEKHKSGILNLLNEYIDCLESSRGNKRKINVFMKDVIESYKNKELPIEVYREFNETSMFKTMMYNNVVYLDYIDENMLMSDDVDIIFNYVNVILPLFRFIGF